MEKFKIETKNFLSLFKNLLKFLPSLLNLLPDKHVIDNKIKKNIIVNDLKDLIEIFEKYWNQMNISDDLEIKKSYAWFIVSVRLRIALYSFPGN